MSEAEVRDCDSQNTLTSKRVTMERENTTFVGDINAFAFLKTDPKLNQAVAAKEQVPANSVKGHLNTSYDWYQNATTVFVTFKVVGDKDLAKRTKVEYHDQQITLAWDDQELVLPLSNKIEPEYCQTYPFSQKLELKLQKVNKTENWLSLEAGKGGSVIAAKPVAVPQSSGGQVPKPYSSNRNWDQIGKDIGRELDNEKPEGDQALNGLFKQIYERSDENTRRAMMKSFQTSGGTVLSTNWEEVAQKDYEGADRPEAPDGQIWAD